MKILLYGDVADVGSGAWCYAETLKEMGHAVVGHSNQLGLERYARSLPLRVMRKVCHGPLPHHRARHGAALVRHVVEERPDVVLILKGLHVSRANVTAMRATGAFVAMINHDDFFSRNPTNWSRVQRAALPEYDHLFTTRQVNVGEVRPINPNVEFLEFAYYPRIHRPVAIPAGEEATWTSDVVFIGTYERERARQLEEVVRRLPARYAVWGGGWERLERSSPLRPFVRFRGVYMDEMAMAIGGAKVALAFLRKANRDDYTQRTFEIPACGGLLLAERTAQHLAYYREGVEAEFFDADRTTELVEKLELLLRDPVRREAMRRAGARRLSAGAHTYRDRLEQVLGVVRRHRAGGRA